METNNPKWTIETYAIYNEALRDVDSKFQEERDRRYREVNKAKEASAAQALELASEIQQYKDEKANELREQINEERLLYVRKDDITALEKKYDALLKPISEFVAAKQGHAGGVDKMMYYVIAFIGLGAGILVAFLK